MCRYCNLLVCVFWPVWALWGLYINVQASGGRGPSLGSDHSCPPYIHLAHHHFHLHCYQECTKLPRINLVNHIITIFIILRFHYSSLWAFIRLRSFMLTLHSSCPSSPFSSSLSSRVYIIHYHCHHLITIFVGHL